MMTNERKLLEQIAEDFHNQFKGKIVEEELAIATEKIKYTETKYYTSGAVIGLVFYISVAVQRSDEVKKQFTGNGGGICSPGVSALMGNLYTDDLNKLFRDTVSFELNASTAYTSVVFFDSSSHVLGHYQAGAVSTIIGCIAGGTGKWE